LRRTHVAHVRRYYVLYAPRAAYSSVLIVEWHSAKCCTLKAASHGPSSSADNVARHFGVILSADIVVRHCRAVCRDANTRLTLSADKPCHTFGLCRLSVFLQSHIFTLDLITGKVKLVKLYSLTALLHQSSYLLIVHSWMLGVVWLYVSVNRIILILKL